jgi:hypothetical protein
VCECVSVSGCECGCESECTRCAVAGGESSFVVLWVTEGNHDPHSPRRHRRPSSAYLPTHPSTTHLPVMLFSSCKAVERDLPTQPLARTSLASPAKTPLVWLHASQPSMPHAGTPLSEPCWSDAASLPMSPQSLHFNSCGSALRSRNQPQSHVCASPHLSRHPLQDV